jgi:hypothetical protein
MQMSSKPHGTSLGVIRVPRTPQAISTLAHFDRFHEQDEFSRGKKTMSNWIFIDVEARGRSPVNGVMTEFGAVHEPSHKSFHGCYLRENRIQIIRPCLSLENKLPPIKK